MLISDRYGMRVRAGAALMLGLWAACAVLRADPPTIENYRLERFGCVGGPTNTPAKPASEQYRLQEGACGGIANEGEYTAIYAHYAGYLVPENGAPPTGSPDLISIDIEAGTVHLAWKPVPGATAYNIYSTPTLYVTFTEDTSGTVVGTTWSAPAVPGTRFYYVTATVAP